MEGLRILWQDLVLSFEASRYNLAVSVPSSQRRSLQEFEGISPNASG